MQIYCIKPMTDFDFTNSASAGRTTRADLSRRIKEWVGNVQVMKGDENVIHVAELQCHEPDCPDFETAITLMYSNPSLDRTIKIYKRLADVTENDVVGAILKSFADGPPVVAEIKAALRQPHKLCTPLI